MCSKVWKVFFWPPFLVSGWRLLILLANYVVPEVGSLTLFFSLFKISTPLFKISTPCPIPSSPPVGLNINMSVKLQKFYMHSTCKIYSIGHFQITIGRFSKRVLVLSYSKSRWAPGLALKKRPKVVRKWLIDMEEVSQEDVRSKIVQNVIMYHFCKNLFTLTWQNQGSYSLFFTVFCSVGAFHFEMI